MDAGDWNSMKIRGQQWLQSLFMVLAILLTRKLWSERLVTVLEVHNFHRTVRFWQALAGNNRQVLAGTRFTEPFSLWMGGVALRLAQAWQGGESWADWLARHAVTNPPLATVQIFRAGFLTVALVAVLVIFWLLRRNFGDGLAWVAILLLLFEPAGWGYSRLAMTEPMLAMLLLAASVAMLVAFRGDDAVLWLAGGLTGVVWATDIAGLVLVPLAAVCWFFARRKSGRRWYFFAERALFWLVVSLGILAILSPPVWLALLDSPAQAGQTLARFFLPPPLAPSSRAILALLASLSPVGWLGLLVGGIVWRDIPAAQKPLHRTLIILAMVVLGWQTLFNTHTPAGTLAVMFPLVVVAAIHLYHLPRRWQRLPRPAIFSALIALQLLTVWLARPYLLPATNPLGGNLPLRAGWVDLPDGIGMDAVTAWLYNRPDALAGIVGIAPPETLSSLYVGRLAPIDSPEADYLVVTRSQRMLEIPSLAVLRYYDALMEPEFLVMAAGETVAEIFAGPAVRSAVELPRGFDPGVLPKPIAFRLAVNIVRPGDTLAVDVLWLADETHLNVTSMLSLREVVIFDPTDADRRDIVVPTAEIFAEAPGRLQQVAPGLVVSRHTLSIPPDLPAGEYTLASDGRPVGTLTLSEK